jgi:hypothetical protein
MGTLLIVGSSATQVTEHHRRQVVYTPRRHPGPTGEEPAPASPGPAAPRRVVPGRAAPGPAAAGSPGGGA